MVSMSLFVETGSGNRKRKWVVLIMNQGGSTYPINSHAYKMWSFYSHEFEDLILECKIGVRITIASLGCYAPSK